MFVILFRIYALSLSCCFVTSNKPNIILIIGDDVGWNDVGFHGSNQIPTPNIDALGYNGVILNRFYTQETCTPSRAALLTGSYPIRYGMQGYPMRGGENRHLPVDVPTMPEQLKKLGYKTHLVGKWHLGYGYKNVTPTRRGFDSHFGYWNGYVGYFDYVMRQNDFVGFDLRDDFETVWSDKCKYATDLFTNKAIEIIRNHEKTSPLFLMLSHLAAHTGKEGTELEVRNVYEANKKYSYIRRERRRFYSDIVNGLDRSIGDVVDALADQGMLDNSIVLFISDNGGQPNGAFENSASNWPLRGEKFTLLEGGVRGVGVVYASKFNVKGSISNELFHITDWLPTFYAAAGGNVDDLGKIDGVNQWAVLTQSTETNRNEVLLDYSEVLTTSAIIGFDGRFKLINGTYNNGSSDDYYGESGRTSENPPYDVSSVLDSSTNRAIEKLQLADPITERRIHDIRSKVDLKDCRSENVEVESCERLCLFDLLEDPCETTNVAQKYPKIVQTLAGRLAKFYEQLVPQGDSAVDPKSDPKCFNGTWSTWLETE